ncbi:MAG TPA: lasso peptide biosynthesis B2 protein [Solirubrobacterales bacterium]|nr:lasso peptide biosynthesis B2 protein [Solirubrobacterales bacterium]
MRPRLQPTDVYRPYSLGGRILLGGEVLLTYVRVRLLLRRRDLPAVVAAIDAENPARPPQVEGVASVKLGARLARVTSRCLAPLPTESRCLAQSLVLMALMARRGVASALVIGVRPGSDFGAHAWVEREGMALLPSGGESYSRLLALGERGQASLP